MAAGLPWPWLSAWDVPIGDQPVGTVKINCLERDTLMCLAIKTHLIAEDRPAKTGRFVLETAGAAASAAVAIATIAARIGVRVGAAEERLRWFQLSPQLMPIGTVLDDGLADLVAPLEIDRTWREPTASGAASTSPRGTRNDGSGANFKSFPRGRSDDHIGSDRGRCLLSLLVG